MADGISWRAAGHVWRRSVYLYRRTWLMNVLPNFFEPVIYLLGMGVGLGSYVGTNVQGADYLAYLAPGLVVASAMNGAAFETTYNLFVKMNFNRTYEAITATPINIEDAMVGELLWASTRGTAYGCIFACVVACFGLLTPMAFMCLLPVALATSWLFAAVGLLFTSFIKVIDMYSFFYTLFLTPMFMFSGIFFPLDRLPGWLQTVAWCTPLYHAVRLARAAVAQTWDLPHLGDMAWVVLAALLFSGVGVMRVKRDFIK